MAAAHPKRIAVIGSGIAGLACAWLLSSSTPKHEVTIYEAASFLGMDANGIDLPYKYSAEADKQGAKETSNSNASAPAATKSSTEDAPIVARRRPARSAKSSNAAPDDNNGEHEEKKRPQPEADEDGDCGDEKTTNIRVDVPLRVFTESYYPHLTGLYNEVGVKFQAENYESSFSSVLGHHFFSYRNLVLGPISIPYIVPFCWPFTSGCCGSGASKQQQDATSAAAGSAGSSSGGSSSGSSMVYLRILKDLLYFLYATPRHLRSGALKPIHVDNSIRLSSSSSSSSPSASASFASSSARSGGAGSTTCSSSSGGAKITEEELTFLDYLKRERYSDDFIYRFALPMVAGICTCTQESAGKYPAYIVVHYLVTRSLRGVRRAYGGAKEVVSRLTQFSRVKLGTAVREIRRLTPAALAAVNARALSAQKQGEQEEGDEAHETQESTSARRRRSNSRGRSAAAASRSRSRSRSSKARAPAAGRSRSRSRPRKEVTAASAGSEAASAAAVAASGSSAGDAEWSAIVARVAGYPGRGAMLVADARGEVERFDEVVLATQANQSLRILRAAALADQHGLARVAKPLVPAAAEGADADADAAAPSASSSSKSLSSSSSLRKAAVRKAAAGGDGEDEEKKHTNSSGSSSSSDSKGAQLAEALGGISYELSRLVLHTDPALMPQRKEHWRSVNFVLPNGYVQTNGVTGDAYPSDAKEALRLIEKEGMATIWMNQVQHGISKRTNIFQTWNPIQEPAPQHLIKSSTFERPVVTFDSLRATQKLWELQGVDNLWHVGSYAVCGVPLLETAVSSAVKVATALGAHCAWGAADASAGTVAAAATRSAYSTSAAVWRNLRRLVLAVLVVLLALAYLPRFVA